MTTGASNQPVPLEDRAAAKSSGPDAPLSQWVHKHEHPNSQIALTSVGRASRSSRNRQGSQCSSGVSTNTQTKFNHRNTNLKTRSYRPATKKHHRTKKRRFNKSASYHKTPTTSRQDCKKRWRSVAAGYCFYCGQPIVFSNEYRCENCWADAQQRWPGKDRSVILHL